MSLFVAHITLREPLGVEKSVTFHLAAGDTAYIAAPNGSGKTRAARQLCGLDHTAQPDTKPVGGVLANGKVNH